MKNKTTILIASLLLLTGFTLADTNETQLNITTTPESIEDTLELGNENTYGNITLHIEDENDTETSLEHFIEGDLNDYFELTDLEEQSEDEYTTNLTYDVPVDAEPGNYTGEAVFNETNTSTSNSTELEFELIDTTSPEIHEIETTDIDATREASFTANITDNIAVEEVTADVVEFWSEEEGNNTVEETRTVIEGEQLTHIEDDLYALDFNQTEQLGDYRLEITAEDQAGNTETGTSEFEITELTTVNVISENFELPTFWAEQSEEKTVVESIEDTEIEFELERFDYNGNSTLEIGVLGPDDESPRKFDEIGDTRELGQEGDYQVVVDSKERENTSAIYSYEAEFSVTGPEYHTELENIIFHGEVDHRELPQPTSSRIREYNTYIGYEDIVEDFEEHYDVRVGDEEYIWRISKLPMEECADVGSFEKCDEEGLGQLPKKVAENEELETDNFWLTLQRNTAVMLFGFFLFMIYYNSYGYGTMETEKRYKKEHVGQIVQNPEDIKTGIGK